MRLFPVISQSVAGNHSLAFIANHTYDLVKEFNSFYQNAPVLSKKDLKK